MKYLTLILAIVFAFGCDDPQPADPIVVEEPTLDDFFEDAPTVSETPEAVAIAAAKDEPAPLPTPGDGLLHSWFELVDDGDGDANTYALDLHVDGLEQFEGGATAFQARDFSVPACTQIERFEYGTMIGPAAYPFITNEVVGRLAGKSYTARVGGYGARQYALTESGTLYRIHFSGQCPDGELALVDYRFNMFGFVLPMEAPPVYAY